MTKLQQAREAAERAQQAAKEAAELVAQLEKEAEPKVWVHDKEKEYYSINIVGGISLYSGGNAGPLNSFPDRKTAERVRDWLALMDRMRIASGGHKWKEDKENWVVCFDTDINCIISICWRTTKHPTIHFPSQQSAKDFINSMTEHEKEVFKRGFPVY